MEYFRGLFSINGATYALSFAAGNFICESLKSSPYIEMKAHTTNTLSLYSFEKKTLLRKHILLHQHDTHYKSYRVVFSYRFFFILPCKNNKALSDEKGFYLDPSPKTRPEKRKLNDFSFAIFFSYE